MISATGIRAFHKQVVLYDIKYLYITYHNYWDLFHTFLS